MFDYDNMSRDELLRVVKQQAEGLLQCQNRPPTTICPFCMGEGLVPNIKVELKQSTIGEWRRDVTMDEYTTYFTNLYTAHANMASGKPQ